MDPGGPDLQRQVDLLAERLRSMALTRLQAPFEPEPTRVEAARLLAQRLADAAAGCEQPHAPVWRDVPTVSPSAAGDLVAVTGSDLAAAAPCALGQVPLRGGGSTRPAELLAALTAEVLQLRRRV